MTELLSGNNSLPRRHEDTKETQRKGNMIYDLSAT